MIPSIFSDDGSVVYSVVKNARAKRVFLKFNVVQGLVVVVPQAFNTRKVPAIVEARKDWISRVADRYRERLEAIESEPALPDCIQLNMLNRSVAITYAPSPRPFSVNDFGEMLEMRGRYDAALVCAFLRRWLRKVAQQYLVPLCVRLASEQGIAMGTVHIRLQKSRWGSCSGKGNINLNARLMFLPEELARYVCMHELAHCQHHNHSVAFWAHLEFLMSGALTLDKALRNGWKHVPFWAYEP